MFNLWARNNALKYLHSNNPIMKSLYCLRDCKEFDLLLFGGVGEDGFYKDWRPSHKGPYIPRVRENILKYLARRDAENRTED